MLSSYAACVSDSLHGNIKLHTLLPYVNGCNLLRRDCIDVTIASVPYALERPKKCILKIVSPFSQDIDLLN